MTGTDLCVNKPQSVPVIFEPPCITVFTFLDSRKVKQSYYRPGLAQRVLMKLSFPDFVTTAQDGGKSSALRTGRLYPQEILLVLIC